MTNPEAAISSQKKGVKNLRTGGRLNNFRTGLGLPIFFFFFFEGRGTFAGGGVSIPLNAILESISGKILICELTITSLQLC